MSNSERKMRLAGMWTAPGSHAAGWRMPNAASGSAYTFQHLVDIAQMCEHAKMDSLFFADSNVLRTTDLIERGDVSMERQHQPARLEATATIAALSAVTSHIGLIATATTTYNEPYNVARRFATIDQISGGRAGWNLVTSQHENEAPNYGFDEHMEHDERYRRAQEFFDVVAGLWDGWDEGAIVEDKENARYSDLSKFHVLNHQGKYFKVKGPLNVPRSPQGRPIIAQAGASGPGRDLAARIADLVFLASSTIEEAKTFGYDLRSRAIAQGRRHDDFKILPGLMPIIGRTDEEARAHYLELQSLITDEQALMAVRRLGGGLDLARFPLDGPLPELPPTNGAKARQQILIDLARAENLTLRDVGRRFAASVGHNLVWGTPEHIADVMEDWFNQGACDGFCIMFPYYRRGVSDFVDLVIPQLRRRGLFRTDYEGRTLRENLGLRVPRSIFD
jgi:FMN-dependent oxidoreductase (nitrilotriacetate monooxygenase family)